MLNIKSVIENHNANLQSKHITHVAARSCSCLQKSECPLNNECLSGSLIYKETVSKTPLQLSKCYYGTYQINWDVASSARPYNGCTRKGDLCLTKKLTIAKADPSCLLNTRNVFISKCRYMNKFTLKCFKTSQ